MTGAHVRTAEPDFDALVIGAAVIAQTVLVRSTCDSWYNGGNVPGKKRMYMGYTGGIPEYRRRCDEIAGGEYTGFKMVLGGFRCHG